MPKKPAPGSKQGPNRNLLIALVAGAAVVAAVVIGGLLLGGGDESVDVGSVAHLEGIPQTRDVLGNPDAEVTLITFEDIQCPVCQAWTEEGQADVITEYVAPGDVKMRFAGLAFLGSDSEKALRYALAAGEQGQLWQYTELLYANQGPENSGWVSDDLLEQLATALDLDWAQLQEDAESAVVSQQLTTMSNEAAQKQVQGTPTFFVQVGDDEAYQVQPTSFSVESFRPILDDALGGS
jgi:protein-disulfide isomerase